MSISLINKKILVTGANGMVGTALVKKLIKIKCKILKPNRRELNLLNNSEVTNYIKKNKPDIIFMIAAKVGGIFANNEYPANYIYENLQIQNNIIHAAKSYFVKKIIFIGSSCIYPKKCRQPIKENYLLTGKLEETNQWYAVAKIAGIKMIQAYRKQYNCDFISVMPCNMYGPNDNYDLKNSHVMAALIKKFVFAKVNGSRKVEVWGSGKPKREFMHVDDFSLALIKLAKSYSSYEPINVGSGQEITITNLAKLIKKKLNYNGKIIYNRKYPDGTPRKILNNKKISNLGWKPKIKLKDGIDDAIKDFKKNYL
tara:strand:+ start:1313 stop:2248 length:936 start_codon:yes stop_codon:yes gene_type:complete